MYSAAAILWLFFCISLLLPASAYAYIDPGSGTLLWQIVIAATAGAAFYLRRSLGQVRNIIARLFGRHPRE